jgi:hypothetical protein
MYVPTTSRTKVLFVMGVYVRVPPSAVVNANSMFDSEAIRELSVDELPYNTRPWSVTTVKVALRSSTEDPVPDPVPEVPDVVPVPEVPDVVPVPEVPDVVPVPEVPDVVPVPEIPGDPVPSSSSKSMVKPVTTITDVTITTITRTTKRNTPASMIMTLARLTKVCLFLEATNKLGSRNINFYAVGMTLGVSLNRAFLRNNDVLIL